MVSEPLPTSLVRRVMPGRFHPEGPAPFVGADVPSGRNSRISAVSRPFARRHDAINAIPLNCRGLIRSRYEPLDVLIDLMAAVMSRPDTKCL